jgi:uncharacterized integral membrane protein (TIGR00698 family)
MKKIIPGLLLSILIAVIATLLSTYISIGSVTIAIILGIVVRTIKEPSPAFTAGITFSEKSVLGWAIMLMGIKLDFGQFVELGPSLILIIISGIALTITLSLFIGKILKLDSDLALLIGVGNAVCGSSAIAAAQSVVKAKDEKVGISIAIINFLGTVGIFLLPAIISLLPNIQEVQGGVLIGNTLQAIGQVSAAGFSLSDTTGQIATVVKMGRILMILPVVLIIAIGKKGPKDELTHSVKIPPYIIGFIIFSLIKSLHFLSDDIVLIISSMSKALLVTAMASIGMKITLSKVLREGKQALIAAMILFALQISYSILIITLFV